MMIESKEKYTTTKARILAVATKLFYDYGYDDTYLEHVADICEITKPLISYHYTSKADLARVVSETYTKENKNVIALKLYKYYYNLKHYDLQVSTAVEMRLINMLTILDQNVNRFYKERINANYDKAFTAKEVAVPFYKIHDRRYKLDIDNEKDEITMLTRAARGASMALIFAYNRGEFDCSLEDFIDYLGSINFKMMNVDRTRIKEIIKESKKVIKEIGFTIEPYFKIV